MTHVTTAEVQVNSPKKSPPTVALNRAYQLRSNASKNQSNGTWIITRNNTLNNTTKLPPQAENNIRVAAPKTKVINHGLQSRIKIFENQENNNSSEIIVKTSKTKVVTQKSASNRDFKPVLTTNGDVNVQKKFEKKASDEEIKVSQQEKIFEPEVVTVESAKKFFEGKTNETEKKDGEPVLRYKTVPKKQPAIKIAVHPWTTSGQVSTDAEQEEVQRMLAHRRKLLDENENTTEQKPASTEGTEIKLRPISLAPVDDSLRTSSGESLTVSFPKALDLARHQQRPLWRDIKGIQEAGLCEELTKDARIRQEAKFELMLSEGSFLHSLNILRGHYMNNIHKHIPQVVSEKDYDILFKHVLDVRSCSEAFLEALDNVWQSDPMLDGVYEVVRKNASESFGAYVRYCRNMLEMSNHLGQLISNNQSFRQLLEVLINREGSQRLTLDAFVTAPMQRITKLPLLMKTILDKLEEGTDEHKQCTAAYEATTKIAGECDEVVNEKKKMEELLRLSHELDFAEDTKSIPIMVPQRSLVSRANVKHFAFRDKAPKREKLQLILLSDILLITKRKSDKLFIVVDYCNSKRVCVKEMENPTLYGQEESAKQLKPVVITLLSNHKDKKLDLVVTFKDQAQCKEWLHMFGEESAEDVVQVIALQEHEAANDDELNLSPGDVIQLTGTEVDGWCEGKILSDNSTGIFPIDKTTKIISSKAKAANLKAKKEMKANESVEDISFSAEQENTVEETSIKSQELVTPEEA